MRIENEIFREAQRQIIRHERRGQVLAEESVRRQVRSTTSPKRLKLHRPGQWALDEGFNPYTTRSRTPRIAHSIRLRLRDLSYAPRHPVRYQALKASGGTREISVYQVADSAISKMLFEGLLKKNLPLLSSRAYAYRKDVTSQDAIQYLKSQLTGRSRLYVAEYDFSSYFDNIDHEHIRKTLYDHFLLTAIERSAVEGFLRSGASNADAYSAIDGPARGRGIPQGTSISLLLANVAAWDLDKSLEGCGVGFCRYADDTLVWSSDYSRLCEAVELLHSHAAAMGVQINQEKSPGIRILVDPSVKTAEMGSTTSLDYLGYSLGVGAASMRAAAVKRIKGRIQDMIYRTLIYEPANGTQNALRISTGVDRDYVVLIWRLRRYLYGDLSEKAVRRYQQNDAPLRRFRGVMSAYPLIDDTDALREIDSWLATQLWLAVRRRSQLLGSSGLAGPLPPPHGLERRALLRLSTTSASSGQQIDLTVPSFRRIAHVITNAARLHGPSAIGRSSTYDYHR